MGSVFLAKDMVLDLEVALKIVYKQDHVDYKRFQQEVLAARKISSNYVIKTFECGYDSDVLFLVTEFIPGGDLKNYLFKNGLSFFDRVEILKAICLGLAEIHKAGIIHRDIKLSNIFFDPNEGIPKIGDLGIVHFPNTTLTKKDDFIGSPTHMAPELWKGGAVTQSVDIYALGITMYELFAEALPFKPENLASVMNFHINKKPPKLSQLANIKIPAILDELATQCLSKQPELRPSAQQIYMQLFKLEMDEKSYFDVPLNYGKVHNKTDKFVFVSDRVSTSSSLSTQSLFFIKLLHSAKVGALGLILGVLFLSGIPKLANFEIVKILGNSFPAFLIAASFTLTVLICAIILLGVSLTHFIAYSILLTVFAVPLIYDSVNIEVLATDSTSFVYTVSNLALNFLKKFFENFSPVLSHDGFKKFFLIFFTLTGVSFLSKSNGTLFFIGLISVFSLSANLISLFSPLDVCWVGVITICFVAFAVRVSLLMD